MENSKKQPVNKKSTINSLVVDSPATFNGMVDALEGLANITESGIDRLINAVNGLSNAATTSNNPDAVKSAAITAIARSIESSERIDSIEPNEELESGTEPLRVDKKPVSVDIEKALAQLKPNGSGLYQPETSSKNTVINNTNNRISNRNSAISKQDERSNNVEFNSTGGSETVFNQLSDVQAKQLSTLEKVDNIERAVDSAEQAKTPTPAAKRLKAATIGSPKFDRSHISSKESRSKTERLASEIDSKEASKTTDTVNKISEVKQADRIEKATLNNTSALNDSATKTTSEIKSTASEISKASTAISDLSDSIKSDTKITSNNTNAINNNSQQKVNSTKQNSSSKHSENSSANNAKVIDKTLNTVSSATKVEKGSSNSSALEKYYRDSNNRLRTDTGRYASKEETNNHTQAYKTKGSGSIRSSIANHLKDNRKRQTVGYAFNGSVFGAIEEAMQTYQMAKFEAQSRGLTSVDGVKKYVESKKQKGADRVKAAAGSVKNTASNAKGATITAKNATSSAFAKVKNRFFGGKNNHVENDSISYAGGSESYEKNNTDTVTVDNAKSINNSESAIVDIDTDKSTKASSSLNNQISSNTASQLNNGNSNKATSETINKAGDSVTKVANKATRVDRALNLPSTNTTRKTSQIDVDNSKTNNTKAQATKANKTKPSTVDGLKVSPATSVLTSSESSKVLGAIDNYLERKSSSNSEKEITNSSPQKASRKNNPLTNSVFIGAQNKTDGLTKKLSKEYHDSHMLKLDKLIKEVSEVSVNVAGGGGGGMLDDLMDLNKKRKRRKRGKRSRVGRTTSGLGDSYSSKSASKTTAKAKPTSKLGKAANYVKGGRFFGGGAKVAGAIGAGAVGAGAIGAAGAAGGAGAAGTTSKVASVASGAGKLGSGALVGAGKVLSKAIPILAIASTAYDAYDGFTNKEKQQETFNLKSTEEASLGQKSAMAAGSVLDLGGLTSGAASLLGDGLGALGFEGAKEALTFDSGDIAKAIYDKSETLVNSGTGAVSSLLEGDFTGAASNAMTFLKTALPTFGMFSDIEEKTKDTTTVSASEKSNSKSLESSGDVNNVTNNESSLNNNAINETKNSANTTSINNSKDKVSTVNSSASKAGNDATGDSDVSPLGYTQGMTIKERMQARKERLETRNANTNGKQIEKTLSSSNFITPISSGLTAQSQATGLTKRETITDVSTVSSSTSTNNSNSISGGNSQKQKGETIVISDNAKTIAALKEISRKLDLNRKTEKPNNGASSVGINSMPKNIPSEFSDPLMERLANE